MVTSPESDLQPIEEQLLRVLSRVIDRTGLDQSLKNEANLVAFAQHIGLPTRLLDWTRAPFIAAYFAASGAVRLPPDSTGRLVVYAMSELYLIRHPAALSKVERLVVPGAANPNMVAQQGEFIKVVGAVDLLHNVECRTANAGQPLGLIEGARVDNHLIAITLPWAQSGSLLSALRDQGIHAASVYPNQQGVADLVREVMFVPLEQPVVPESLED